MLDLTAFLLVHGKLAGDAAQWNTARDRTMRTPMSGDMQRLALSSRLMAKDKASKRGAFAEVIFVRYLPIFLVGLDPMFAE